MGKYYFILLSFLFVCFGCWGHASSENEIKSLLEKAEQSLYSNPVQSAFFAQRAYKQTSDVSQKIHSLSLYAQAERLLGNYDGGIQALYEAAEMIPQDDHSWKGKIYNQMSISYCSLGDYTKAIELNDEAMAWSKVENDSVNLARVYNNRGIIHIYINEFQQAERFFNLALEINRRNKDLKNIAANLNNLCLYPGKLDMQIRWISEAIVINRNLNATWSLSENYNNLGRLYYYQKKYPQAIVVLDKAFKLASKVGAKGIICDNYEYSAMVYAAIGNYKKAYEKQVALYTLSKEIQSSNKLRMVEQNMAEKRLLFQQQETERKEQEYKIAQLRRNILTIVIVAFSLAIIGLLLHQRFKRKKKLQLINTQYLLEQSEHEVAKLKVQQQKMELDKTQAELETNKQEITDFAVFLQSRNEVLDKIRDLIKESYKMEGTELITHLKKINAFISQHQNGEKTNNMTLQHIDEKNQEFIKRLTLRHPNLTQGEIHLATLLRVELSTKEIAMLTGTTPKTINMNRYRLRKSLELSAEDDLVTYIRSI